MQQNLRWKKEGKDCYRSRGENLEFSKQVIKIENDLGIESLNKVAGLKTYVLVEDQELETTVAPSVSPTSNVTE